ncbi:MAG: 2-aminoethylphosphonate--pyruvate transaminase, partial [Aestuariivirgaceae bacterium]
MPYLLTPGPLTTSRDVKLAMLADWGSRDIEFRSVVAEIRSDLKDIAGAGTGYECVLVQGSGTFAIEAALASFAPRGRTPKSLVVINGAYGERAAKILDHIGNRGFDSINKGDSAAPSAGDVRQALEANPRIGFVFIVHCETTSGIINPIDEIVAVCKEKGKTVMVDAMSSFGALPLDMGASGMDIMVSSSNKCIEGVPGFSYVLVKRGLLEASAGNSHSVVLDLYDQWRAMEANGQFRFTPPTHALVAFHQALKEFKAEGGVAARGRRYQNNKDVLVGGMRSMGFETLLDDNVSGPIIQTFLTPGDEKFDFDRFYDALRGRGYAIYPGKLTRQPSFRIGTIGKLDHIVMRGVLDAVRGVLKEMGVKDLK